MSAKSDVISYVERKFVGQDEMRGSVLSILRNCDDDGAMQQLRAVYGNKPEVTFTDDPNVDSGAAYDSNLNRLMIKPVGNPLELADLFLFESTGGFQRRNITPSARRWR